jgi:hypothetical protein
LRVGHLFRKIDDESNPGFPFSRRPTNVVRPKRSSTRPNLEFLSCLNRFEEAWPFKMTNPA